MRGGGVHDDDAGNGMGSRLHRVAGVASKYDELTGEQGGRDNCYGAGGANRHPGRAGGVLQCWGELR